MVTRWHKPSEAVHGVFERQTTGHGIMRPESGKVSVLW